MIRKKRTQSQVDLFADELMELESEVHKESRSMTRTPSRVSATSSSAVADYRKTASVDVVNHEDSGELFEQATEEITLPETDETPVPQTASKKDGDSRDFIINRDFADGFYVRETPPDNEQTSLTGRTHRTLMRRRLMKLLLLVFLIMILLTVLNWKEWVTESSLFTLKNIVVTNTILATREEVLQSAGLEKNARLGTINLEAVAERVKKNPLFRNVTVSRNYPSTVVITVEERRPLSFLIGQDIYAMDEEGVILPKLKPIRQYNLPVITGIRTAVKPGLRAQSNELKAILQFLKMAKDRTPALYFEISEINRQKDRTVLYLNTLPVALVADMNYPARTLLYMELVQQALKDGARLRDLREVDLRYDGQLVLRKK